MLASGSPRRRQIALAEGWNVHVLPPPDSAEAAAAPRSAAERLEDYVLRMARTKGRAVADIGVTDAILACDTLSEVDGQALGKPIDVHDARRMLTSLSGKRHRVVTGIWLRPAVAEGLEPPPLEAVDESLLEMEPLSEDFIEWYLASGMWQGKAGACGFQDDRLPLRLAGGSATNVVGLPVERLRILLASLQQRPAR